MCLNFVQLIRTQRELDSWILLSIVPHNLTKIVKETHLLKVAPFFGQSDLNVEQFTEQIQS